MRAIKSRPKAPAAAPSGSTLSTTVTAVVALDPIDWFWAPWRRSKPLARPAPAPFDPADCADRLGRAKAGRKGGRDWKRIAIAPALSIEEARFWLEAMLPAGPEVQRPLERAEIVARLRQNISHIRPEIVLPLSHFLPPEAIVGLLLGDELGREDSLDAPGPTRYARSVLRDGFRRYLLPYLDTPQKDHLRALLRGRLDIDLWPSDARPVPVVFSLAAALGMHAELRPVVESWPDNPATRRTFVFQNNERQNVIFGLDGPEEILHHLRRLRLRPLQPEHARAWLAHFELGALDWIRDTIEVLPKKDQATRLLEVLCLVRAPEAAPHLLQLKLHSGVPRLARRWLDEQVGNAVAGLVPVAAGRGKLAEAALEYLADARRLGHGQLLEEQLRALPSAVADRLRRDLLAGPVEQVESFGPDETPAWLSAALGESSVGRKERLPDWVQPDRLPPVVVGHRRLNDEQTQALLAALRRSTVVYPDPLVQAVREHATPASLAAFAWKLVEAWLDDGMPPAGIWALNALGFFGDDGSVAKLMSLLSGWRDREGHSQALVALECLATIGSDTALLQLQRLARNSAFKHLQARAGELLEGVAVQRGLTREQLEDRIMPGLGRGGYGVFDYGRRQFRLVLAPDLKRPGLVDRTGRHKTRLPRPTAREAAKAGIALQQWESLKQHLREVVKVQVRRLEEAMIAGRRWPADAFEPLLWHPVLGQLARRVVWGGHDDRGRLVCRFRVAGEGHCAGLHDEPCPDEVQSVSVVHPAYLSEEERQAWTEAFAANGTSQPFPQLGRPVHALEPGMEEDTAIAWLAGLGIPSSFLFRLLQKQGWQRAGYELELDAWGYLRPFPGVNVTAFVELMGAGPPGPSGRHELYRAPRCSFLCGLPSRAPGLGGALTLDEVDPAVLSEVLSDLHALAAKGQVVPMPPPPPRLPDRRPAPIAYDEGGQWQEYVPWDGADDEIPF